MSIQGLPLKLLFLPPVVTVADLNAFDCDGNGLPDDFDGDYEWGNHGAFFGVYTPHNAQQNADCEYGLHLHAGTEVVVSDAAFVGADGAAGYEGLDLLFEVPCELDGIIGDDDEDCLVYFHGWHPADPCADLSSGPNAEAGVWTFLSVLGIDSEGLGTWGATTGTITIH